MGGDVRPDNINNDNCDINEIINGPSEPPSIPKVPGLPPGLVASHEITYVTVDSGACDSIVPPHLFKNTPTMKHGEFGKTYAACGGGKQSPIWASNQLNAFYLDLKTVSITRFSIFRLVTLSRVGC